MLSSSYDNQPCPEHPQMADMCELLRMTPLEILVLSATFESTQDGRCLTVRALADLLPKTSTYDEVDYTVDLLLRMEIFEQTRGRNRQTDRTEHGPTVKRRVMQIIRKNNALDLACLKPVGLTAVLEYVRQKLVDHDQLGLNEVREELSFLAGLNKDLPLFKALSMCSDVEAYILISLAAMHFTEQSGMQISYFRRYLLYCRSEIIMIMQEIQMGAWEPMQKGLVSIKGEHFMGEDFILELTKTGEDILLEGLPEIFLKRRAKTAGKKKLPHGAILPKDIKKVDLLFDDEMLPVISDLRALVGPKFFRKYRSKIATADRMQGITILLHGHPGTGKTELAMQLARESKRTLIEVNVANVLSKWVGESEQNTRSLFRDYDELLNEPGREPILFLNECDALLSRRMDVRDSVDKMNNSMQNILLDEMERFRGIMLATTNLTRNLDAAFERRFLYKV